MTPLHFPRALAVFSSLVFLAACGGGPGVSTKATPNTSAPTGPNTTLPGGGGGGTTPGGESPIASQIANYESQLAQISGMPKYDLQTSNFTGQAAFQGGATFQRTPGDTDPTLADLNLTLDFSKKNGTGGVSGTMNNFRNAAGTIPSNIAVTKSGLTDNELEITMAGTLGSGSSQVQADMLLQGGYMGTHANGGPSAIAGDIGNANLSPSILFPNGQGYSGEFFANR